MTPSALALVGFVAWTLLLAIWIVSHRSMFVLTGKRAANEFDPSGRDVSEFAARLCRAHANCYENLPMFAALILLAMVTGNGAITDPLARWALVARVGQSTVHLISTSEIAVMVRVALFSSQIGIMVYWVYQLGMLGFQ